MSGDSTFGSASTAASTSTSATNSELHGDVILAGASVRSLAQSALRDGLKPICVDMFNDADLQHTLQQCGLPHNLLCVTGFQDVVRQLADVPADIPVIPIGGLENEFQLIGELRQQRPVWLSAQKTIQAVRDPQTLFSVLQDHGCAVPKYCLQPPASGSGRWLKKQLRSAGGTGIILHDTGQHPDNSDNQSNVYWQEYIAGIPLSATFVNKIEHGGASQDGRLQWLGCALQLSGCEELYAASFQFCGNAGPVAISVELQVQILNTARAIVRHWPLQGVFGLDFMISDGAALLLEVNPRPTASHELYEIAAEHQPGHVALHAAAWQPAAFQIHDAAKGLGHLNPQPPPARSSAHVRCVLYADSEMRLTTDEQQRLMSFCLNPAQAFVAAASVQSRQPKTVQPHTVRPAHSMPDVWLADIPAAGAAIAAGTPFCSIYVSIGQHSVDECGLELDKRAMQMLRTLPGNVFSGPNSLLRRIREQIAVLQHF